MKIISINTSSKRGGAAFTELSISTKNRVFIASDMNCNDSDLTIYHSKILYLFNVIAFRFTGIDGFFSSFIWIKAINKILKHDLIHIHNVHGYYMPFWVLKKIVFSGVKIVITHHDFYFFTGNEGFPTGIKNYFQRLLVRRYPFSFVNNSERNKKIFKEILSLPNVVSVFPSNNMLNRATKIGYVNINSKVIYNGVIDKSDKRIRKAGNVPRILFVADRLDNEIKGFGTFISALNLIKDLKFEVTVVGKNAPNVKDCNIKFVGHIKPDELRDLYLENDIYVTCSSDETFGRTVVEAISMGLVVVCTEIDVFREILADNAHYFPIGDFAKLYKILDALIKDKSYKIINKITCEYYRDNYSNDRMSQEYFNLYKKHLIS